MVVGAFPAAKLGVLAMKQISKPIANVLKTRAKSSPFFRTYICMPPAQFYNWMEIKTRMWALNLGKPTVVPTLNEAQAIELGANLLGEAVIFAIGAGLLILEYQRSARKEALKEDMLVQEKAELTAYINELAFRVERQDAQIREMERLIGNLHSRSWAPTKLLSDLTGIGSKPESEQQPQPGNVGNVDPENVIFSALHFLNDEIFHREEEPAGSEPRMGSLVAQSLVYLVGNRDNRNS